MKTVNQTAKTNFSALGGFGWQRNVAMKVSAFISNIIALCFTSMIVYNVTNLFV